MMPPETLRFAAGQMRRLNPPGRSGREFWHALADWLEASAHDADGAPVNADGSLVTTYCDEPGAVQSALKVARAYLGEPA